MDAGGGEPCIAVRYGATDLPEALADERDVGVLVLEGRQVPDRNRRGSEAITWPVAFEVGLDGKDPGVRQRRVVLPERRNVGRIGAVGSRRRAIAFNRVFEANVDSGDWRRRRDDDGAVGWIGYPFNDLPENRGRMPR